MRLTISKTRSRYPGELTSAFASVCGDFRRHSLPFVISFELALLPAFFECLVAPCCDTSRGVAEFCRSLISDAAENFARSLVAHVARVEDSLGLEEDDVRLLVRDGHVLDAARNNDELALFQTHVAVAQAYRYPALDDEEHLVLLVVLVPDE